MVLDHCQANANTRQAPSRCQLGNPPASSQCSCWDSHGRSTVGKLCNTTWLRVRVPQGLTLQLHPESIARSGKSIAMEGADTWTRGTVGEHTTDFSLCPIRLAFSLVPQQCLVFTSTGKHLLLALLPMERGKSSHPKQKNTGICFQVYSSHSFSLQVKSPELAFFLCKASFLAKGNWRLSLMLSAE